MRTIRFLAGDTTPLNGCLQGDIVMEISGSPFDDYEKTGRSWPLSEVHLLAPVLPGKVIGVATNFPGATGRSDEMSEPLVFLKPSSSVAGPEDIICSPFAGINVWGEGELAIVVGKEVGKNAEADATEAVFGYTVANDVSADNLYGWDHHLARSKAADSFCVLGPWVDSDFVPGTRQIESYHNGSLLRQGTADQRIFKEPELIAWLASWMTLEAGDVILTGAPTRVRERQFLEDGDIFECRVDGLGSLRNEFRLAEHVTT